MVKRSLTVVIIILLSVACRHKEIKTSAVEINRVRVTRITSGIVSLPVHSTGELISSEEFKLSFKTGGIVGKIYVKEGDRVKKGSQLAELNLAEISANANQAGNNYAKALRDYTRAENLYRDSVVTLEQKQNAATALEIAKSTLEIVKFNLEHSTIVAPYDGVVLRKLVRESEMVSSGYPVFLFGSTGKYWKVKTAVADKDMVKINPGDSASVTLDAYPGVKFSAVIDQVGEMSNPFTGTYDIEMTLQPTDYRLASGFIAGIDLFPSKKRSYSMIPVESIVEADGYQGYIYTITSGMTVQKVRVNIEALIGSRAAVSGIPEGITVVVSEGAAYLKNGMKVEILK
jgi:RND family efflux transporter MFP subunit